MAIIAMRDNFTQLTRTLTDTHTNKHTYTHTSPQKWFRKTISLSFASVDLLTSSCLHPTSGLSVSIRRHRAERSSQSQLSPRGFLQGADLEELGKRVPSHHTYTHNYVIGCVWHWMCGIEICRRMVSVGIGQHPRNIYCFLGSEKKP